jgi:hypothetical protein
VARPGDQLLVLSAKGPGALRELAARHARHLESHPETSLADVSRTTTLGRAHFADRLAVVATGLADARRALGLSVVGGLLVSQLLTLYITPVLYTYMAGVQGVLSKVRAGLMGGARRARRVPAA